MLIHVPSTHGRSRWLRRSPTSLERWLVGACLCAASLASHAAGVKAQASINIAPAAPAAAVSPTDAHVARPGLAYHDLVPSQALPGRTLPSRALPSLCPGSGDLQHVREYDGALGQTRAFVDQHKGPVGRISANQLCSGTLISRDLFLTAGHCIDAINVGSSLVDFNFEKLAGSDETAAVTSARIARVVEDGRALGNLDYAIFQLESNPGSTFGYSMIEEFRPAESHLITIIQHPNGERKQVEVGHAKSFSEEAIFYDDLDTEHGSSGAGILDDAGRLVGVHSGGDCDSGAPNVGVRMDRIIAVSPTLRGLLPGTLFAHKAKVSRLQVQDFGAAPITPSDAIDAEAIVWLQGFGEERFAFNLRSGTDASTHQGMFDQLRDAYGSNLPIRVEYYREAHRTNRILRVIQMDHVPVFPRLLNDLSISR